MLDATSAQVYFTLQSEGAMDDLSKALGDISNIRRQVANSTVFRGYGPATLACTAGLAAAASTFQARLIPTPAQHVVAYLTLWIITATLACIIAGWQMYTRSRRMHSGLSDEMIAMAVQQFLPALGTGFLLSLALTQSAPASAWLLPGLWQMVFALGIFSSCRFMPRAMFAAGAWYLITGLVCIVLGQREPLSPLLMGIPFGIGQLLIAAILYTSHAGEEA